MAAYDRTTTLTWLFGDAELQLIKPAAKEMTQHVIEITQQTRTTSYSPSSWVGTRTVTTSPLPTFSTDSGSRRICSLNSSSWGLVHRDGSAIRTTEAAQVKSHDKSAQHTITTSGHWALSMAGEWSYKTFSANRYCWPCCIANCPNKFMFILPNKNWTVTQPHMTLQLRRARLLCPATLLPV